MTKPSASQALTVTATDSGAQASGRFADSLLDLLGRIPHTERTLSSAAATQAQTIARSAARKAATTSGTLALPPGALGWLTIVPELAAVWALQAQMVADIAGVYGKQATLDRERMLYCLFRHTAAQAVRDLVVQVGGRFLVQQASVRMLQLAARKIGLRVSQRAIGAGVSRWLPLIGAAGVAAYAYYDTLQVARSAVELFESEAELVPLPPVLLPDQTAVATIGECAS